MVIRSTNKKDLKSVAKCHQASFPGSLSSKLGTRYCMKMLSWYLEDIRGEIFHLEENGQVIGYCGGILSREPGNHGSATSVTQYTFKALIASFLIRPWLIFHPEIRTRLPFIWRNIKLKLRITKPSLPVINNSVVNEFIPSMGLVVIGVSPENQGKGYGTILLKEFERRASEKGFKRIYLSVKKDNAQAIAAYSKNGWVIGKTGDEELSMYKELE
jgi:GNAT superfamily N-acetyltransferase